MVSVVTTLDLSVLTGYLEGLKDLGQVVEAGSDSHRASSRIC